MNRRSFLKGALAAAGLLIGGEGIGDAPRPRYMTATEVLDRRRDWMERAARAHMRISNNALLLRTHGESPWESISMDLNELRLINDDV